MRRRIRCDQRTMSSAVRRRAPRDVLVDYVAGVTVGQDFSERALQTFGDIPQMGPAKSFTGFSPIGPWVVTLDELDVDNLPLRTAVDEEIMQNGSTASRTFSVAELVSFLSHILELYPGDLIFTCTPEGVGLAQAPPRFIKPGQTIVTTIDGIGELKHVAKDGPRPPFAEKTAAGLQNVLSEGLKAYGQETLTNRRR